MAHTQEHADLRIIAAGAPDSGALAELWRRRSVVGCLARRDFLVRYRQTAIGVAWVLLRPALQAAVFALVFGHIGGVHGRDGDYVVLALAGLIPWQFFANVVGESSISIVNNAALVTKVYFPRLALPLATLPVNLLDLAVSLALLAAAMAWSGHPPTWTVLLLPLALLPMGLVAFGCGAAVAALMGKYRDVKNVIPFLLQIGLFLSPVAYPTTLIPPAWRVAYGLNPMVAPIDLFRWCIMGPGQLVDVKILTVSLISGLLCLIVGLRLFRHLENEFADVL